MMLSSRLVVLAMIAAVAAGTASSAAGERDWEVRGELQSLKPGEPEIAVLRLSGGRLVEVPLDALSESSRDAVRVDAAALAPAAGADGAGLAVRGPFGRPVKLDVPESLRDVEADAVRCRIAADAADVYRLFLAGERPDAEQQSAARDRLREWTARADKGVVRLGDRWLPEAEARAAADEAVKIVAHALELMRQGNATLAEEELRKAARADPESGRANFIIGLCYAVVARNPAKSVEHFEEASVRDPVDAAALADLAVAEVLARRYPTVADHFRRAVEWAPDPAPVGDNLAWVVKLAGSAKTTPALAKAKMPEKTIDELSAVYRSLTQDLQVRPPDNVPAPRWLGPDGLPCQAATVADVAKCFNDIPARAASTQRSLGFVVATGHVVCPRRVLVGTDGALLEHVAIEMPAARGRRLVATVVAAPEDGEVALLSCEELEAEPLPLAEKAPAQPEILAVDRSGDSWLDVRPTVARGAVATPPLEVQARGRFVHTAVVPRGLGGGPILDASGAVVGMVAATPRTDSSGNVAGFGIPIERIRAGLREHLPELPAAGDAVADGQERCLAATVFVSAGWRRSKPESRAPAPRR